MKGKTTTNGSHLIFLLRKNEWRVLHQVIVSTIYRQDIIGLAYSILLAGHIGVGKTFYNILQHFRCARLKHDVLEYCR